jgi:hypothetical protein
VKEDPDHPELPVVPRSRDVVVLVLVQYAGEVAVARHGDQLVHVLRQQLAPHDHRVSATQLPELLEQTFTPRKRNHTPEAEQGRGLQSNTWTTVVYLCTRTVEVEGAMDGEDAGVAADVAQLAVVAAGQDLAAVAAEELDDAAVGRKLVGWAASRPGPPRTRWKMRRTSSPTRSPAWFIVEDRAVSNSILSSNGRRRTFRVLRRNSVPRFQSSYLAAGRFRFILCPRRALLGRNERFRYDDASIPHVAFSNK